ncbi:MAG TPA: PTS sugar transporter subunit IIA [bacterium]|nr:PTS sugar transporter subunit IIA [bacterium]
MNNEELTNYFDEQLFLPDLMATSKDELFVELVDQFVKVKYLKNRDIVLEMLRQRENLGSTGIGKNVAIPHGRTTSAQDIMIAFGKSRQGIEYDAIDNKPVHLIFMIIAPPQDQSNMYLPILGKMVEILNKAKNRNKLLEAETYSEFIEIISRG